MPNSQMVRIVDYCTVVKGKIGIKKATPGKYPLVTTAKERSSHNEYHFDKPSVIIPLVSSTGHGHASLNRIHYQDGEFAVGSILCTVSPKNENVLDAKFLYHYLDLYKRILLVSRMKGMANVTLSIDAIKDVNFPLLSIEKQLDWIRLFENTSFYTGYISTEITHQQTLLKKLRQSILQDAISGKLTKNWRKNNPDIEPGSKLLKRVNEKKVRLIKEGKIKKQELLPPIADDEIPFELPEGWVWCRLGDSGLFERGKSKHRPRNDESLFVDGTYPFIQTGNVAQSKKNSYVIESYSKSYNEKGLAQSRLWPAGTLCITIAANIAETGFLGIDACFPDSVVGFTSLSDKALPNFIRLYIDATKSDIEHYAPATAQKNINLGIIGELLFPLPPEKEIIRIVNKVEGAYKICDQLESQITKSQKDIEFLMQAVLKEAFSGGVK
jgi:restriction endonuclease S subunit